MPSVGNLDWWQNSQGRPGLPLETVWHLNAVLLMPLRVHEDHEIHPRGLTVLEKSRL